MQPQTIIFMGRSGSGKGTQAALLIEYLKKQDSAKKVLHIETGKEFKKLRDAGDNYTNELIKQLYNTGGLMPEFLPIWLWSDFFVKNINGDEHLIMDGVARRVLEAEILHSAFTFYQRPKPTVILVNVGNDWAFDRLMARKRADDKTEEIRNRLSWFDTEVAKSLDFYKSHKDYRFLDINGEQSIEDVHREIVSKLRSA